MRQQVISVAVLLCCCLFFPHFVRSGESLYKFVSKGDSLTSNSSSHGPINPKTIPKLTTDIYIEKVPKAEIISDLRYLVFVQITKSNISITPDTFQRLPKLFSVKFIENKHVSIESGSFQRVNIRAILIMGNVFPVLEDGIFFNLPLVDQVYLDNNEIKEWNPNAFIKTPKMEILSLAGNDIRYLPADSFKNVKSVKRLFLGENLLEVIDENAFRDLTIMETLDLRHNHLMSLPEKLFAPSNVPGRENAKKKNIKSLSLETNHLSFLPAKLMQDLSESREINIARNPWKCACYFNIMNTANLHKINIISFKDPVCVGSQMYCDEVVNCDFIYNFYTLYPESARKLLTQTFKAIVKQKVNFFEHVNKVCKVNLTAEA